MKSNFTNSANSSPRVMYISTSVKSSGDPFPETQAAPSICVFTPSIFGSGDVEKRLSMGHARPCCLSIRRHPHIVVDCSTESRKARASYGCGLRPSFRPQSTARKASGCYAILEIVLCPKLPANIRISQRLFCPSHQKTCFEEDEEEKKDYPFDTTLRPREYRSNQGEILGRAERSGPHVLEAPPQLFSYRQAGELLSLRGQRRVVTHL